MVRSQSSRVRHTSQVFQNASCKLGVNVMECYPFRSLQPIEQLLYLLDTDRRVLSRNQAWESCGNILNETESRFWRFSCLPRHDNSKLEVRWQQCVRERERKRLKQEALRHFGFRRSKKKRFERTSSSSPSPFLPA